MLQRIADTVWFQSPVYTFEEMCERSFMTGVLDCLRERMGEAFSRFDFMIVSGAESELDLSGVSRDRTVVFHLSDETSSVPRRLCASALLVFKSYLPAERLVANLRSLPLGCIGPAPFPPLSIGERAWNVFFSGNLNGNRAGLARALSVFRHVPGRVPMRVLRWVYPGTVFDGAVPRSYLRFTDGFRRGLPAEDYYRFLADARIVLCPAGFHSAETFRHFEAMRAGAVVVSEALPPLDFYRDSPIIQVKAWDDLIPKLRGLLDDPDALVDIQARTLAWYDARCSESAVARTVDEAIRAAAVRPLR
jgi:glycosyltransferase involved in cell wall biosynthesis